VHFVVFLLSLTARSLNWSQTINLDSEVMLTSVGISDSSLAKLIIAFCSELDQTLHPPVPPPGELHDAVLILFNPLGMLAKLAIHFTVRRV